MARFGFGLGLLLIAGGAALAVYGSPYYMLDWGGTLVVSGLIAGASGVILLMLAAILNELRRIGDRFAAVMPAAAPPEPIPAAMTRAEPVLEAEPVAQAEAPAPAAVSVATPLASTIPAAVVSSGALSSSSGGLSPVTAGAAAVAAGGLATAAASILSSISHGGRQDGQDQDGGTPQMPPDTEGASNVRDADSTPALRPAADPYSRVDEAVRALRTEAGTAGARHREFAPGEDDLAQSDLAKDDLDDLRSDLLFPGRQDGPRRDGPDLDRLDDERAADEASPAQAADDGVHADLAENADDRAHPAQAHPTIDVADDASASDAGPARAPAPPMSEEGVIAAYTVGDSSYTMFADGRIRADTPDGELTFASMDELKEHMARKRLGA